MKIRRNILLFLVVILSIQVFAQKILDLNTLKINDGKCATLPTRDVEETDDGLIITYRFSNVLLQNDELCNEASHVKIVGFWPNNKESEPEILSRWDTFVVPNINAKVVIIDSIYTDYHMELAASSPILEDTRNDSYIREKVKKISSFNGFYPYKLIPATRNINYREQPLLEVCICPLQYNYTNKIVRLYKEIKYKILFDTNSSGSFNSMLLKNNISVNNSFLRNIAVNGASCFQKGSDNRNSTIQLATGNYLIVTVPKYESAVNRFAEWKRRLGYNVFTSTQTTWDTTEVKNVVRNLYYAFGIEHLLIFGGHNDVPGIIRDKVFNSEHHFHPTDLYYGCFDDGYTPSIFRGRLLVNTLEEANVVVDKIINYEKNPVTDTNFYNNSIHCAYFQDYIMNDSNEVLPIPGDGYEDRRFTYTSERILNRVIDLGKSVNRIYYTLSYNTPTHWNNGIYADGSEIPMSLQKPFFEWNGNNNDITNGIDQKAFYLFMRGHGGIYQFGNPNYTTTDINSLNNGNNLPVVFSICCKTGKFDVNNCFCETFLKKQNGGCVAIFGATQNSLSGPNDVLAEGMFDAIWPSSSLLPTFGIVNNPSYSVTPTPTYCLGQILDQGLKRADEAYSGTTKNWYPRYTSELFHCFGDPSMMIHTEKPTTFSSAFISMTNNSIVVNTGGELAKITFCKNSTGDVVSYLGTNIEYPISDDVQICISAHNKIPYIAEYANGTLYIQNDTISTNRTYIGTNIKVGANVTSSKPAGEVRFANGKTIMQGNLIELQGGTTILQGAELEIKN